MAGHGGIAVAVQDAADGAGRTGAPRRDSDLAIGPDLAPGNAADSPKDAFPENGTVRR